MVVKNNYSFFFVKNYQYPNQFITQSHFFDVKFNLLMHVIITIFFLFLTVNKIPKNYLILLLIKKTEY